MQSNPRIMQAMLLFFKIQSDQLCGRILLEEVGDVVRAVEFASETQEKRVRSPRGFAK